MIIIVSDNPGQMQSLLTHLKQKGYLYSVVPDERKALEAIRTDRANLVLIDTGCSSFHGFSLCKTIKNDEALKDLPVLLLTDLCDVSVVLSVLDTRADAFLTKPVDPEALLSATDDLLRAQEGEKPKSSVRTRFVVSHEGCDYAVYADRRQLLEFLLSTFELAVSIRSEQGRVQAELQAAIKELSERLVAVTGERDATVKNLHGEVEERTKTINRLTAALQAKDQQETLLRTQSDKFLQDLAEKGTALESTRRLLEEKNRTAEALEGQVAALTSEKESIHQESREQIGVVSRNLSDMQSALIQVQERLSDETTANRDLREQVADLSSECDRLTRAHEASLSSSGKVQADLEAQGRALEEEQRLRATAESEREDLRAKYANIQQFLDSASRDIGVLNAALSEEKEKHKIAQDRLNAALREGENKDRAVQALTGELAALASELQNHKAQSAGVIELPPVTAPEQEQVREQIPEPDNTIAPPSFESTPQKEEEPLLPSPTVQLQISEPAPPGILPEGAAPEGAGAELQASPSVPEHQEPEPKTAAAMPPPPPFRQPADWGVNRNHWFDMIKWAHHTDKVPEDQRKSLISDLMKMSRLVQQGRHLTNRQETEIHALIARMNALGYRFPP